MVPQRLYRTSTGPVSNPTLGEVWGGPGKWFCAKFHNSFMLGDRESLRAPKAAHFGRKTTLVLGSHKNATDTEKGYEGMHSFTKHSGHRP